MATASWNCKAPPMQISTTASAERGRGRPPSCLCLMAMLVLLLFVPDFIVALKDVSVMIPQAVKRGSNALLTCNYDMENDTLYSVKWYKGKREFYRYTPKENPAMKVFAMTSGLNVERNLSNQSHVVLQSVALNISGKFTCEISVEAPTFQTAMVSGEMEVVELPEEHTMVTGIQARYRIGDLVDGNCSIKYSKPAANLTWTINGIVVPPHHIKTYQIEKHENSTLESVMSAMHFMVTTQHFLKGQMRLKCTANIFDIFKEEMESVIEEDRPRIMASGRSYDINNYPLDEHTNDKRGYEDHNESYLTYYSAADGSTSGASTAAHEIFWHAWLCKFTRTLKQIPQQLHSHINRRLRGGVAGAEAEATEGAAGYKFDAFAAWQQQLSLAAAATTLCWLLAHQIIDCQYSGSKKAATLAAATSQQQQHRHRQQQQQQSNDVTMSKATLKATHGKRFYNCQKATLWPWERRLYVAPHDAHDDGNIASAGDDLTATRQQLSATLAGHAPRQPPSQPPTRAHSPTGAQRLLMTLRKEMPGNISC